MPDRQVAVPVTILTGFLGAGKTTLLKRILMDPRGVRFGVLINDFGAVNIDSELVVESTADRVSLQNGCVCCSIRDDLVAAIHDILDREPRPDRLVIEASGVSRPLPIADALDVEGLAERTRLDGIFCMIDAAGFQELDYAATELALDQATGSDIAVLNKIDLAGSDELAAVEATLRGAMPQLRIVHARYGEVAYELLFGIRPGFAESRTDGRDASSRSEQPRDRSGEHHHDPHDHDHDHGEEFEAWSWRSARSIDEGRFRAAIRNLPAGIMRAKGVLRLTGGDEARLVFQMVGKRYELTPEKEHAPAVSNVVAIGRRGSFDVDGLTRLFDDCVAP